MAVKTRAKRKRQLPISGTLMRTIKPITPNQERYSRHGTKVSTSSSMVWQVQVRPSVHSTKHYRTA